MLQLGGRALRIINRPLFCDATAASSVSHLLIVLVVGRGSWSASTVDIHLEPRNAFEPLVTSLFPWLFCGVIYRAGVLVARSKKKKKKEKKRGTRNKNKERANRGGVSARGGLVQRALKLRCELRVSCV